MKVPTASQQVFLCTGVQGCAIAFVFVSMLDRITVRKPEANRP